MTHPPDLLLKGSKIQLLKQILMKAEKEATQNKHTKGNTKDANH